MYICQHLKDISLLYSGWHCYKNRIYCLRNLGKYRSNSSFIQFTKKLYVTCHLHSLTQLLKDQYCNSTFCNSLSCYIKIKMLIVEFQNMYIVNVFYRKFELKFHFYFRNRMGCGVNCILYRLFLQCCYRVGIAFFLCLIHE